MIKHSLEKLRTSPEILGCKLFSKFTTKTSPQYGSLINSYAEIINLIDGEIMSKEISYTAQQNYRSVKHPKNMQENLFIVDYSEKMVSFTI